MGTSRGGISCASRGRLDVGVARLIHGVVEGPAGVIVLRGAWTKGRRRRRRSSRGYSFKGSLDQGGGEGGGGPAGVIVLRGAWTKGKEGRRRRSSRGYSFKGSLDQGEEEEEVQQGL